MGTAETTGDDVGLWEVSFTESQAIRWTLAFEISFEIERRTLDES